MNFLIIEYIEIARWQRIIFKDVDILAVLKGKKGHFSCIKATIYFRRILPDWVSMYLILLRDCVIT